jgi:chromosome segregation ATPase
MGRRYGARLNDKTVLEISDDIEAADHKVVQALEEALVSTEANIKNILEALPNAGARREQIEQGLRSLMQQRDALREMLKSPDGD